MNKVKLLDLNYPIIKLARKVPVELREDPGAVDVS